MISDTFFIGGMMLLKNYVKLFLRMLVMFVVQLPGIVSSTAEKLNTPLEGQRLILYQRLFLLRLHIHIFMTLTITGLLIVRISCRSLYLLFLNLLHTNTRYCSFFQIP